MSDPQPHLRYASRRVGAFILIAFGLFVIAVLQAEAFRDLFKSTLSLRVILPESGLAGLNEGASVEVLGTDAGDVVEIVIDPEQNFHAVVEIEEAMQPFVRRDSKVFIRKQFGIAGAAFLEITRGIGEPLDWDYAVLTAESGQAPTESMGEILEDVRARVLPIVDDVHRTISAAGDLIAHLQAPDGQLQSVLADLNTVTARLAAGEGTAGRLLADDALVRELETTLGSVNQQLGRLDGIVADLQSTSGEVAAMSQTISAQSEALPEMITNASAALASFRQVMAEVERAMPEITGVVRETNSASVALPTLLAQTQQTMAELQQLLVQLQGVWLFGGGEDGAPEPARLSPLKARP
ncbi:MAG TPA: MlaD family protein [Geminicoccaceae bacterium]|nr:MlaD family protein [Geminicoccaceae bacterium]